MNSTERVINTILGKETDRQPIYGWVKENLSAQISESFGSVEAFDIVVHPAPPVVTLIQDWYALIKDVTVMLMFSATTRL